MTKEHQHWWHQLISSCGSACHFTLFFMIYTRCPALKLHFSPTMIMIHHVIKAESESAQILLGIFDQTQDLRRYSRTLLFSVTLPMFSKGKCWGGTSRQRLFKWCSRSYVDRHQVTTKPFWPSVYIMKHWIILEERIGNMLSGWRAPLRLHIWSLRSPHHVLCLLPFWGLSLIPSQQQQHCRRECGGRTRH